ncbi:MAG: hypothetical protein R6X02_26490 [Enhygromyxa sp.]
MSSALPRFTGPAQARQRLRLIAALGMLAIAALATGGLASLSAGGPVLRSKQRAQPPATSNEPRSAAPIDMSALIEEQVEQAERELREARAAIRAARRLGQVDERELVEFERRLERAAGQPPRAAADPLEEGRRGLLPLDVQPRPL